MARGRFFHTMDAKGRVSLPAVLRVDLQTHDDRPPILTNLVDCAAVGVFSHERWLEIEQRLASMSQMQPEIQSVQRLLVSGAVECPIDTQGRILVPPHLREHAGLERDVTIAGVGRRIEIWDRARFDDELAKIRRNGPDVSRVAAELGL
jgi:MraZ protein